MVHIKKKSFGDTRDPNYDGVHMRGKMAVQYMLTDIYPHLKQPREKQREPVQKEDMQLSYSQQLQKRVHSGNL